MSVSGIVLIRYGEIHLKGNNRPYFLKLLEANIAKAVAVYGCSVRSNRTRYEVQGINCDNIAAVQNSLLSVSGITSISAAAKVPSDFESLQRTVLEYIPKSKKATFRMTVNRADKRYKYNSDYIARELGAYILSKRKRMAVDLHNADIDIRVDIREDGSAYIFDKILQGAGGMPVGSAGRGLLLLSGGLDSPVAGYLMAKRGMSLDAVHFESYPYTSREALTKVQELAERLRSITYSDINLTSVSVKEYQEAVNLRCDNAYMICLLRRHMIRVAEKLALERGCKCLITGESLGQVASQTIESLSMTDTVAEQLPILRPLIAMDKTQIIGIARDIGTYDISIKPHEDCCTVFLPKHPIIKPRLERVLTEERKLLTDAKG